jgi:hypothetical protein
MATTYARSQGASIAQEWCNPHPVEAKAIENRAVFQGFFGIAVSLSAFIPGKKLWN